jgi:hypothetical protein
MGPKDQTQILRSSPKEISKGNNKLNPPKEISKGNNKSKSFPSSNQIKLRSHTIKAFELV